MGSIKPRSITIRCPKCAYDEGALEGKIVRCDLCGHIWTASHDELQRGHRAAIDHPWKILFEKPKEARYAKRVEVVKRNRLDLRATPTMIAIMNMCIEDLQITKTELVERALVYFFAELKNVREAEGVPLGTRPAPALGSGEVSGGDD